MDCFARKIDYAASGAHVFVALIELSENKEKGPSEYVIYRAFLGDTVSGGGKWKYVIFKCNCATEKEAKKFFPYGHGYWDSDRDWENTTKWLYDVAVGGSYQVIPKGEWVKVQRPTEQFKLSLK
ncbi:MAG: hypothetical protein PHP03_03890 [Candidatus Pacebacteria bacterium]|nr:hypothetical protein [Candidatus Paceibacterota bacterium]